MNFYKHHLGDYDGATVHLTWDEDHAYTRLLRVYYRIEKPIPLDPGAAYRLVRATTKAQKEAVTRVLHEFFEEQADGWHNARADEEIAAYQAQASTNRRIAKQRTVGRTDDESSNEPSHASSTKRAPNHEPRTRTRGQEPEAINPQKTKTSAAARRPAEAEDDPAARARPTWRAYIAAIQARYPGRTVLRDETANSQMAKFVKRVGADDGPKVAALYVSLNKRRYVDCHHSVATMLACVEELYSQWTSGLSITEAESRQADQTSARVEQVHRLTREKAA